MLGRMFLTRFLPVLIGLNAMTMRGMGMMGSAFVISCFMMPGGLFMVPGCVIMVFGSFFVMILRCGLVI